MGKPLPSDLVDPDDKEVLLGLPGAWAEETNEPADHYTTKIGGQPDWPVPLQDVNDELLKCGVCDGYLGLVAQIYAPLTLYGSKLEERSLFILGCPSASCGVDRSREALEVYCLTDFSRFGFCTAGVQFDFRKMFPVKTHPSRTKQRVQPVLVLHQVDPKVN